VPGGSIEITWTRQTQDGSTQVQLNWRERGGPPLSGSPTREGFCTMLIEDSLPEAEVERRFEPEGLVCTITLKLHETPERGLGDARTGAG
jgi:two-component system CheB/CheR fusion protein